MFAGGGLFLFQGWWRMADGQKIVTAKGLMGLLLAAALSGFLPTAFAQQSGLVTALQAKYKTTTMTFDDSKVTSPGTEMEVQVSGINAQPVGTMFAIQNENKVVDGKVQQPSKLMQMMKSKTMQLISKGDKVYITKIEAKTSPKEDDLKMTIITTDAVDLSDGSGQKHLIAILTFKLPKDALAESAPDQVEQMIEAVITPAGDSGQGSAEAAAPAPAPVAAAPPPPPPPPPPPAAPAAPQTISIGQTPDQVTAALGQPQQIIDLGAKKTYIYKDMKVIFVKGKVSDVQ
jgi:hypothetical protein